MIPILEYGKIPNSEIFAREIPQTNVEGAVSEIIRNVRSNGDAALYDYTARFDKAELSSLAVTDAEIQEAFEAVEPEFLDILRSAAKNIRAFHAKQLRNSWFESREEGIILGQKITPLAAVGVYVPGGKASYPSSVLMNMIPAQVAGVKRIVMTTPAGKDGSVSPITLVAANEGI